jgi:hypothetical protein
MKEKRKLQHIIILAKLKYLHLHDILDQPLDGVVLAHIILIPA